MDKKINKVWYKKIPIKWRVIFIFLFLILLSHIFRSFVPLSPETLKSTRDINQQKVEVQECYVDHVWEDISILPEKDIVKNDAELKKTARVNGIYVSKVFKKERLINIAYKTFCKNTTPASNNLRTILLIHGTGNDGESLYKVAENLSQKMGENVQVVVPDLPGFGSSERDVTDYSIESAAAEMFEFLDVLKISNVDVLGFGQGGGVAIYMAHQQEKRINSLALVSSVGSQEYMLLGNHIVNKIVYGFHMLFFKTVQDVLPHFGVMDAGNVNKYYARTLWDSDISEIKKLIREWNGPLYIAHGENDVLSPIATAEYSKKLAPEAVTYFVPGGHYVFLEKEVSSLISNYSAFLEKSSNSQTRSELLRKESIIKDAAYPQVEAAEGVRVLILMLIILICTFVAEDPTCLASGLLVAQGLIDFIPVTLACLIGIFIGDSALYLIGRFLGRPVLRKAPFKWIISEQEVDRMSDWFDKNPKGFALIISSRFIPGSRVPTFVAAGIMRLNMPKLILLFFIAAAVWTPPLILLAEHVGAGVIEEFKAWHHYAGWIVIGAIVGLFLLTHYILPAFTWRGRRRHVMMRRQWTQHEYWPNIILMLPIYFHFFYKGIINGSWTLWTLVNPGLGELGGYGAASKYHNYQKLVLGKTFGVRTVLIDSNDDYHQRRDNALIAMSAAGISFPCIVKPEFGDGGVGVLLIKCEEHLLNWLELFKDPAIIQEYVSGNEYEVIWSRRVGRKIGRIQSVVQKEFVVIKGDGERKLDDLIWADNTAVSNGKLFSKMNFKEGSRILKAGEFYPLTQIGSRIRGARFNSRPELRDGALSDVLDKLADECGGVHYLTLDIRAENDEDFKNGINIKITGVKGAGSFSSVLYDGYVRMGRAYSRIFKQIDYCFSIGKEFRDEDSKKPCSLATFFSVWGSSKNRQDFYIKEPEIKKEESSK